MFDLRKGEKFVIENNANYINKSFSDFLIACEEDRRDLGYSSTEISIPNIVEWFDEDPDCFPFNDLTHECLNLCYTNNIKYATTTKEEIFNPHLVDFDENESLIFGNCKNLKRLCLPNLTALCSRYILVGEGTDRLEYIDISSCERNLSSLFGWNECFTHPITIKVKNEYIAQRLSESDWFTDHDNAKYIKFEYGEK